jgi:hypothetical protein
MFGKPKKKKVVYAEETATNHEKTTARQNKEDRYPEMSKSDWGKPRAADAPAAPEPDHNMKTNTTIKALGDSKSGIKTDEEKRIEQEAKFRKLHPGQAASYDKRKTRS